MADFPFHIPFWFLYSITILHTLPSPLTLTFPTHISENNLPGSELYIWLISFDLLIFSLGSFSVIKLREDQLSLIFLPIIPVRYLKLNMWSDSTKYTLTVESWTRDSMWSCSGGKLLGLSTISCWTGIWYGMHGAKSRFLIYSTLDLVGLESYRPL